MRSPWPLAWSVTVGTALEGDDYDPPPPPLAERKYVNMPWDQFVALCDQGLQALDYIEPIVRRGHQILKARRPWWKKLLDRHPKSFGLQKVAFVRSSFKEHRATAFRLKKPCEVDTYILEHLESWIDWERELREQADDIGYR